VKKDALAKSGPAGAREAKRSQAHFQYGSEDLPGAVRKVFSGTSARAVLLQDHGLVTVGEILRKR
jgi:hypothetical protein